MAHGRSTSRPCAVAWRVGMAVALAVLLGATPAAPRLWGSSLGSSMGSMERMDTRAARGSPDQLAQCLRDAYVLASPGTSWDSAMADVPPVLVPAGVWWSSKGQDGAQAVPLTLVTQASANRVTQLWAQCKSWPGPLSAAVYVGLFQERAGKLDKGNEQLLARTKAAVAKFHETTERDPSACHLDIVLVYEIFTDRKALILYPVNQLRNLARLQAATDVVALMDVDMLVSAKLARSLLERKSADALRETTRAHTVYVLPAFEAAEGSDMVSAQTLADRAARQSKEQLLAAIAAGAVVPFDDKRFPIGHNATLFPVWYETATQYKVEYKPRYEPWVLASRRDVPWHDVRFRGYGQNKIVQIAATNASGFRFTIHPTGFIIHRAHKATAARQLVIDNMREDSRLKKAEPGGAVGTDTLYGHGRAVWEAAKAEMDAGRYTPVLDAATRYCMGVLPWWRGR